MMVGGLNSYVHYLLVEGRPWIKTWIPQKLIHTKLTGVEKLVVFSLHSTMINYLFLTMNLYNIIIDFSY